MPRKKQQSNLSLREQVEAYVFDGIAEFEQLSGIRVERIEIKHRRGIGFGAKETMEVNIITQE